MPALQSFGREATHDGLADPIVVGLDVVERPGAGTADQVVGSERGQRGEPRRPEARRAGRVGLPERLAGDGEHLEQVPGILGQALDPRPQDIVERDGAGELRTILELAAGVQVLHQLVDEVRASAGLPRDHPRLLLRELVVVAEQLERQLARSRRG